MSWPTTSKKPSGDGTRATSHESECHYGHADQEAVVCDQIRRAWLRRPEDPAQPEEGLSGAHRLSVRDRAGQGGHAARCRVQKGRGHSTERSGQHPLHRLGGAAFRAGHGGGRVHPDRQPGGRSRQGRSKRGGRPGGDRALAKIDAGAILFGVDGHRAHPPAVRPRPGVQTGARAPVCHGEDPSTGRCWPPTGRPPACGPWTS